MKLGKALATGVAEERPVVAADRPAVAGGPASEVAEESTEVTAAAGTTEVTAAEETAEATAAEEVPAAR